MSKVSENTGSGPPRKQIGFFEKYLSLWVGLCMIVEVLLMKDRRKVAGLWILIATAMVGFAALDLLGWVKLNPPLSTGTLFWAD